MSAKPGRKRSVLRRALAVLLTLILIALALGVFLFRDQLNPEGIRRIFGVQDNVESGELEEPFSYESGSGQIFALCGDDLAVASSSGLLLFDPEGTPVVREIFGMETPALAACDEFVAAYDVGGESLRLAWPDGSSSSLEVRGAIRSVTLNASGYMAVTTEESGYNGLVRVYDPHQTALFEWYSGQGYALSGRVTPDGKRLVVHCVSSTGSSLKFFRLDSEAEQGSYETDDQLFLDFWIFGDGRIAALSEEALVFLSEDGQSPRTYSFSGKYLTNYSFSDGFAALFLGQYRTGSSATLVTLSSEGSSIGSRGTQRDLISLSAGEQQILALYSDGLVVYTDGLEESYTYDMSVNVKSALLRDKGDVLLLSGYSAEIKELN